MAEEVARAVEFLEEFCATHGLRLDLEGECGFGRECVGILDSIAFVDWEGDAGPHHDEAPNAYHKHDCLAVLGRSERSIEQLRLWVERIVAAGGVVERNIPRHPREYNNAISLQMHGRTRTRLTLRPWSEQQRHVEDLWRSFAALGA